MAMTNAASSRSPPLLLSLDDLTAEDFLKLLMQFNNMEKGVGCTFRIHFPVTLGEVQIVKRGGGGKHLFFTD